MTDHAPGLTSRQGAPGQEADAPPGVSVPAPIGLPGALPGDRDMPPEGAGACTQAQLRRFIKSRPYVPLHELRRRFGLNGADDDVSTIDLEDRRIFVGLPAREAGLLGELVRHGEVGYELLLDPTSPIVVGVFPMRPIQRP